MGSLFSEEVSQDSTHIFSEGGQSQTSINNYISSSLSIIPSDPSSNRTSKYPEVFPPLQIMRTRHGNGVKYQHYLHEDFMSWWCQTELGRASFLHQKKPPWGSQQKTSEVWL